MPRVSLPPEVSCDVVRCLDRDEDKHTLFACSLTCKSFLSESRRTIFETVKLFWPPDKKSFDSRFLQLLQASPELGSSVRKLYLTFSSLEDADYIPNAGALLGRGFPKVTELHVHYMRWNDVDVDVDTRTALVSGFQTVKRLTLIFPKFVFSHKATEFISSFPLLTHLNIHGDAWTSLAPSPRYSPLPVNLTSVAVSAHAAGVFAELMRLEPQPKVQDLSLAFVCDDHNYNVTSLLKILGDDLQELLFLNSQAMRAGARALRSCQGKYSLGAILLYICNICTQASTCPITPDSGTSRIVSACQTLVVRSASFFHESSRRG